MTTSTLPETAPAEATEASLWTLDPTHSSVHFAGRQMMISTVRGRFSRFDARVVGSDRDPENARIEVTVDTASVDSGFDARDQHLRSADFLDVDRFPTIQFRSTSVRRIDADRLRVAGHLTIKGLTRPVELEARLNGLATGTSGARRAAFSSELTIDRHDWGITWNMPLGGDAVLVGREIVLQFELTFEETAIDSGLVAAAA